MANVSLKELFALLREAGFELPTEFSTVARVEAAAAKRGIRLHSQDKAALRGLVNSPGTSARAKPAFDMVITTHPQLAIPSRRTRPTNTSAAEQRPIPDHGLPPWGRVEERLQALSDTIIPIDWFLHEGQLPGQEEWDSWVDDLVVDIDSLLWPEYDPGDPGVFARPGIKELFDADFAVLDAVHDNLNLPIPALYPTQVFHRDYFDEEDDRNVLFGHGYERYDPTLSARILHDLPNILAAGMADKVGTLDLQLKLRFQRPRAYQVALLQNREVYGYCWARTSNTPSLVSGHCLQAAIAGCTAFVALAADLASINSLTSLAQLTVDIGDRRVYAGVHYPSDNLSSWYVALKLVRQVFSGDQQKLHPGLFLWDAISRRSDVYKAIVDYDNQQSGQSPYAPMLKLIHELAREEQQKAAKESVGILSRNFF